MTTYTDYCWSLIVATPTGFAFARQSKVRLDLVDERLDMLDLGIPLSRSFIHRFDHELTQGEIERLIDKLNSLEGVLKRYIS